MSFPSPGEAEHREGTSAGVFPGARWFARGDITFAVILGLFAMQAALRFASPLSGDVAWYLYAAGRLLDGAALYTDVIEVSSPLGLWLAMPVVALARAIPANPIPVLKSVLLLLSLASIFLSARLLSLAGEIPREIRNLILIAVAALMLFLPGADFGQREHVAIMLVTPWLLLQWQRLAGREVSPGLAILVGALAAPGFLVKPHFIFAFVAVVLVVVTVRREWRNVLRPEALVVLFFLGAYFAIGQFWLPGRVEMSTIGTLAYIPFYGETLRDLAGRLALPGLLVLAAVISAGRGEEHIHPLQTILVVAGVAFLFAAFVQVGLAYQFLPALYCLSVAACVGVAALVSEPSPGLRRMAAIAFFGLALVLVVGESLARQIPADRGTRFALAIAREAPDADTVFIASNSVDDAFPLVVEKDLVWAARFPRQWFLRFAATNLVADGAPDHHMVRFFLDSTVGDLVALAPDIIFIERPETAAPADVFNHLHFWKRDYRFEDLWSGYDERAPIEGFSVYVRK